MSGILIVTGTCRVSGQNLCSGCQVQGLFRRGRCLLAELQLLLMQHFLPAAAVALLPVGLGRRRHWEAPAAQPRAVNLLTCEYSRNEVRHSATPVQLLYQ